MCGQRNQLIKLCGSLSIDEDMIKHKGQGQGDGENLLKALGSLYCGR